MKLSNWATRARNLAGFLILTHSVRLLWISAGETLGSYEEPEGARATHSATPSSSASPTTRNVASSPAVVGTRADLKALRREHAPEVTADDFKPVERTARRRHKVVVDFGPDRSEVFLAGKKVGKVPYVGEFDCAEGDIVQVEVLPPSGMPLERTFTCSSGTLLLPSTSP